VLCWTTRQTSLSYSNSTVSKWAYNGFVGRPVAPVAAILVCAVVALAQNQQEENPKLGRVTGTVVESKSGEPVRKAFVLLRRDSNAATGTLTDGSGKFTCRDLDPGVYVLSVEKDGWVTTRDSKAMTVTVTAGQTAPAVTLRMLKTAAISGRVLDAEGDPIAGVAIQLTPEPSKKKGPSGPWASTNDRGEYRAFNVAPGQYRVCGIYSARSQRADVRMQPPAAAAYPKVCFPGTAHGTIVTVEPGTEVQGIDFQMVPARAVKVRGRVIYKAAEKPMFAFITLQPTDGGSYVAETLVRDPDGNFEVQGVLPGQYRLTVAGASVGGESKFASSKTIDVTDVDLSGVDIVVGTPRRIDGKLLVPEGRKIPQVVVVLVPREQGNNQAGGFAQVSPTGEFSFPEVGAGEYDLVLGSTASADDLYVSAIRLGDSDALTDGVRPDIPGPLEIVLKPHGGTLSCSVIGEKDDPVPAGHVLLIPDPPKERQLALMGECRTDANGTCEILGITPGDYHAYAFPTQAEIDHRDPNAIKAFEKYGKPVKIGESERRDVELKTIAAE
jgi:hypothetical protein